MLDAQPAPKSAKIAAETGFAASFAAKATSDAD